MTASTTHIETIRDKATVGNAMPIPVGGVGLVVGLEGTGGDCPPDSYRSILENELRKEGVHSIRKLLSSPDQRDGVRVRLDPAGRRQGRSHRSGGVAAARQPGHQFARRLSA